MAPQVLATPRDPAHRKTERTVDTTKSSAPAHPSPEEQHLATLVERYRHELVDVEERCELRERILHLRWRLGH